MGGRAHTELRDIGLFRAQFLGCELLARPTRGNADRRSPSRSRLIVSCSVLDVAPRAQPESVADRFTDMILVGWCRPDLAADPKVDSAP